MKQKHGESKFKTLIRLFVFSFLFVPNNITNNFS